MMAYEVMNKAGAPEHGEQSTTAGRSAVQHHGLLIFYIAVILVSMGG